VEPHVAVGLRVKRSPANGTTSIAPASVTFQPPFRRPAAASIEVGAVEQNHRVIWRWQVGEGRTSSER
jgi:hypothetical protein